MVEVTGLLAACKQLLYPLSYIPMRFPVTGSGAAQSCGRFPPAARGRVKASVVVELVNGARGDVSNARPAAYKAAATPAELRL